MATLTLAPQHTWFAPTDSTIKRANMTQIDILDSYTPTGNETHSWDASEDKDGSIMCYVNGTQLIIAGNGSGRIYANPDSYYAFCEPPRVSNPRDCFTEVTTINGLDKLDVSKATTFMAMFGSMNKLTAIEGVSRWNTSNVESLAGMFNACSSLTSIQGLENWDTSKVTTMMQMFTKCIALKNVLPLSDWDVSKVEDMSGLFKGNGYVGDMLIEQIDLSRWNTSSCRTMASMFYGCGKIKELDLNKWDVSKVWDMNHLFADCMELETIKISNWDVSFCRTFSCLFNDCEKLEVIDLSGWNTKNIVTFQQMFERCTNLKKIIGIEQFDTTGTEKGLYNPYTGERVSGPGAYYEMFSMCKALEEIDLSSFDTRFNAGFVRMFYDCPNLKTIYVGDLWSNDFAKAYDASFSLDMFFGAGAIVGEDGTTFDWNKTDIEYAQIDGINGKKGYLTHIKNKDQEVLVNSKSLYRTAKAIRNKLNTKNLYLPHEMGDAINNINGEESSIDYPIVLLEFNDAGTDGSYTLQRNNENIILSAPIDANAGSYVAIGDKVIHNDLNRGEGLLFPEAAYDKLFTKEEIDAMWKEGAVINFHCVRAAVVTLGESKDNSGDSGDNGETDAQYPIELPIIGDNGDSIEYTLQSPDEKLIVNSTSVDNPDGSTYYNLYEFTINGVIVSCNSHDNIQQHTLPDDLTNYYHEEYENLTQVDEAWIENNWKAGAVIKADCVASATVTM